MKSATEWEDKLNRISAQRETVGEIFRKYTINNSVLMVCRIWDGIILWSNEIRDKYIPGFPEMNGSYITFNYCADGRCEIGFPVKNRYIYMKKGMISLNQIQPADGYYYPGRKYDGLELAFDLNVLADGFPAGLADYGLTRDVLLNLISENDALLLTSVSQQVRSEAERLLGRLRSGDASVEELRFAVLHLFCLLKEERLRLPEEMTYVSKGQRQIAAEAEERLTEDLSVHYVLSDIAGDYGISASALKKYFSQVYGQNVSDYLKIKRMEKAVCLLSETGKTIREIALSVGYSHQGKFSKAFKEYSGCSPLEYRRLHFKQKEND